jgi:hypothetical protein
MLLLFLSGPTEAEALREHGAEENTDPRQEEMTGG